MCGLVGMCGFLEHKHKNMMKELLFLDTLRGKDSTGLSVVDRGRGVLTRKMTVPGYEFIEHPSVDRAMSHADQVWIGHNRFRTRGDVSRANAHPFEVLDDNDDVLLVGAHNGTIDNKWDVERKLNGKKFDTDSEAVFNLLVSAPDFKDAIRELKGAWSLVWWDSTTDSIHFCRNKERPLVYAFSEDHKVLMWASESWMLINTARRCGVELEKNEKGFSCWLTLPDNLYTMEIPQERNVALPDLQREGGYTGAPVEKFQKKWMGYGKGWWDETEDDILTKNAVTEESKKAAEKGTKSSEADKSSTEKPTVILGTPPALAKIRGFEGAPLTHEQFARVKAKGCAWCKDGFSETMAYGFLNEDSLVCTRCLNDRHPKTDGDRVRPGGDELDDDPFPSEEDHPKQEQSPEHNRLVAASIGAIAKAFG